MRPIILCLLILVTIVLPVGGQDEKSAEPEMPAIEEALVVTAQFKPEKAEASLYRVRTLAGDRLRAQGLTNLREALAFEPNISLDQHSVFGSSPAIAGISRENVKIMQDGVPVIGRLNGIIDLEQLDLAAVRSVEIIEGPVSVYYGTEALAGVVNLVSEVPGGDGWQAGFDTTYRSEGDQLLSLHAGHGNGRHGLRLSGTLRRFDGFDVTAENRVREWNEREQTTAQLAYSYRRGGLLATYRGRFFEEDLADLGEIRENFARDATYTTRRDNHDLTLRGFLRERLFLDLLLAYADYQRDKTTALTDLNGESQPFDGPAAVDHNTAGQWLNRGMITFSGLPGASEVQVGYELTRERGVGDRLLEGGQTLENAALFAGLRLETDFGLSLQPAVRYSIHSDYDAPPDPGIEPEIRYRCKLAGPCILWAGFSGSFYQGTLSGLHDAGRTLRLPHHRQFRAEGGTESQLPAFLGWAAAAEFRADRGRYDSLLQRHRSTHRPGRVGAWRPTQPVGAGLYQRRQA